MMKVVHITKLPDGGASLCAMRICNALQVEGVDSRMLLMQGEPADDITIAEADWAYRRHDNVVVRIIAKAVRLLTRPRFEWLVHQRKRAAKSGSAFFTSPVTGYTNIANHPLVRKADIVHLHWISDFVDFPTFFMRVNKPIVWTAHDENPGLGGFHYLSFKKDAPLAYVRLDRKYEDIKRKAIAHGNMPHMVAISSYMGDFFKQSAVLKNCPSTLIHNGVDCDAFNVLPKDNCRAKLVIPADKKVFLFSSWQIEDKRKGLHLLIPALDSLCNENILLVCLGNYKTVPQTQHIQVRCEGLVKSNEKLSEYYSAADFFVLSSFQEAFAQTPLEAMACGTPVVGFPCSGIPDLITHKNGVIAADFTKEALADALLKAMNTEYSSEDIRQDVVERFSYGKIARQYIELYNQLLSEKQGTNNRIR